jgi:ferredoxin/flavodoxin---NADP+ reductase
MQTHTVERVTRVRHWNNTLFSFTTTRSPGFRFDSGQFVMIGLETEGRPLMRAYSVASASHDEHLEFLSIKVPDGPLTSRLQHLQPGDAVLVGRKSTGSLLLADLRPGKTLYLLATGTGLAPFMSLIREPDIYERFEQVVLVHGVRYASELAYRETIVDELPKHEYLGAAVSRGLRYFPSVTRERFMRVARVTDLIRTGQLWRDMGLPPLNPKHDRAMICGGPAMLAEVRGLLDADGFKISEGVGRVGDYVIERAFVED